MGKAAILSTIILFSITLQSQKLVKKIDSLINSIENSESLKMVARCDTSSASHSDYWIIACDEFYTYNDKVFKIVRKADRFRISNFYESL